jgi:hypothetical protein
MFFIFEAGATLYAPPPSEDAQSSLTSVNSNTSSVLKKSKIKIEEASIESVFSVFNFDEIQDRSQLVQFALIPTLKLNLLKNLDFYAQGLVGLSTGRVQTRFDNPTFGSLNLNELILSFRPIKNLSFDLGALNQNSLQTSMLIYDRAFPGVQVRNSYTLFDSLKLELKAQYSIPNSVSFETDRTQNEPVPTFLTQGFGFNWDSESKFKLKGQIHHFTFSDLPSVVAFQSGRLGNEVIGVQSAESRFVYGFDGFSQSYEAAYEISKIWTPKLSLQIIENSEAPTSRNRSQWTGLGVDIFTKNYIFTPSFGYFFAESDSTPALYSDVRLGRNNREGVSYKLKINFIKSGFSVSANYIQANLIETDPVQNDLRTFEFMLELPRVQF